MFQCEIASDTKEALSWGVVRHEDTEIWNFSVRNFDTPSLSQVTDITGSSLVSKFTWINILFLGWLFNSITGFYMRTFIYSIKH